MEHAQLDLLLDLQSFCQQYLLIFYEYLSNICWGVASSGYVETWENYFYFFFLLEI